MTVTVAVTVTVNRYLDFEVNTVTPDDKAGGMLTATAAAARASAATAAATARCQELRGCAGDHAPASGAFRGNLAAGIGSGGRVFGRQS